MPEELYIPVQGPVVDERKFMITTPWLMFFAAIKSLVSQITNLFPISLSDATKLTGTLPDANLSTNVALRNAPNHFTAQNDFVGAPLGIGTTTPTPHDGTTVVGVVSSATFVDNLWRWVLGTVAAPVMAATNAIFIRSDTFDAITTTDPTLHTTQFGVYHTQVGGNGNREAFLARLDVSGGTRTAATFSVGAQSLVVANVAGGNYFGSNPGVLIESNGAGAAAVGEEVDTDCRVAVADKIGIQISDLGGSVGVPTNRSAGIHFINQGGALGYADGLLFSVPSVNNNILRAVGGVVVAQGIDLGAATIAGAGMILPNGCFYTGKDNGGTVRGLIGVQGGGTDAVLLGPGTMPVNLIAGQLAFPATQNPSAGVNTLDDYEEGTWTPVDSSGAGLVFATVDSTSYVKVGQQVTAGFHVIYPVTASGLGAVIGGLPFTSQAAVVGVGVVGIAFRTAGIAFDARVLPGATTMAFTSLAGVAITNVQLSGSDLRGTAVYRAAA